MSDKTWSYAINQTPLDETTSLRQSQSFLYQLKEQMKTNGWTVNQSSSVSLSSLPTSLRQHSMDLLPDGRLLVIGGYTGSAWVANTWFGTISGNTISWAAGTPVPVVIADHGSTVLSDGRILIGGGWNGTYLVTSTYLGTISGNNITWVAGTLPSTTTSYTRRMNFTGLSGNRVFITQGGTVGSTAPNTTAGIYVYVATIVGDTITYTTSVNNFWGFLYCSIGKHTLVGSQIYVSGSFDNVGVESNQIWNITVSGTSVTKVAMTGLPVSSSTHSLVRLSDGRLLFTNGIANYLGTVAGTTITWVASNANIQSINQHRAITLSDGTVLLTGGTDTTTGSTLHNIQRLTISSNTITGITATAQSDLWSDYSSICYNLAANPRSYMVLTSPEGFVAGLDGSYTGDQSKMSVCIEAASDQAYNNYKINLTLYAGIPSYSASLTAIPTGGQSINLIGNQLTPVIIGQTVSTNGYQITPITLTQSKFNFAFTQKGGFWSGIGGIGTGIFPSIMGVLDLADVQQIGANDYPHAVCAFQAFNNTANNFTYSIFDSVLNSGGVKVYSPDGTSGTGRAMVLCNANTPTVIPGYNTTYIGDVNGDILESAVYLYNATPNKVAMIGKIPDFKITNATLLTNGSVTPSLSNTTHTIINQVWVPSNQGFQL